MCANMCIATFVIGPRAFRLVRYYKNIPERFHMYSFPYRRAYEIVKFLRQKKGLKFVKLVVLRMSGIPIGLQWCSRHKRTIRISE